MSQRPRPTTRLPLLLADVDGTLVTREKVLTPWAQAAVRALREHGIRFAMTSGRPPRGMAMLVEPLELDYPHRRLQRRHLRQPGSVRDPGACFAAAGRVHGG